MASSRRPESAARDESNCRGRPGTPRETAANAAVSKQTERERRARAEAARVRAQELLNAAQRSDLSKRIALVRRHRNDRACKFGRSMRVVSIKCDDWIRQPEIDPMMSLVRLLGFRNLSCGCVTGHYRELGTNREITYVEEKGTTCDHQEHRRNHTLATARFRMPAVTAKAS